VNLIILEPGEIPASGQLTLTGPRAVHLMTVLHAGAGDTVRIGLLDGPRGTAVVQAVNDGSAVILSCRLDTTIPPRPPVDLLLALPRPKVMRRLWAQLAAIGVDRIILTNAGRVERQYFDTHLLTPQTYVPLLVEGLQQAKDTRLPRVSIHKRFRVLIEDELDELSAAGPRLLAHPSATAGRDPILRSGDSSRVLLAVGPEGGWNTFERDLLAAHGFTPISMGERALRTDTACIALLAIVHAALRSAVQNAESV
jgi:RsmE family RNA methyltransferase